jgi:NADP+-dependent farnesol dehydrogenase
MYFQSISPGLTNQDILADTDSDLIKLMPRLEPQDVSDAVMFAISTPENVNVR